MRAIFTVPPGGEISNLYFPADTPPNAKRPAAFVLAPAQNPSLCKLTHEFSTGLVPCSARPNIFGVAKRFIPNAVVPEIVISPMLVRGYTL